MYNVKSVGNRSILFATEDGGFLSINKRGQCTYKKDCRYQPERNFPYWTYDEENQLLTNGGDIVIYLNNLEESKCPKSILRRILNVVSKTLPIGFSDDECGVVYFGNAVELAIGTNEALYLDINGYHVIYKEEPIVISKYWEYNKACSYVSYDNLIIDLNSLTYYNVATLSDSVIVVMPSSLKCVLQNLKLTKMGYSKCAQGNVLFLDTQYLKFFMNMYDIVTINLKTGTITNETGISRLYAYPDLVSFWFYKSEEVLSNGSIDVNLKTLDIVGEGKLSDWLRSIVHNYSLV